MSARAAASSFDRVAELSSHESERYVLAAIVTRPAEVFGWIADRVDGTDFYSTDIGHAFSVTQTMFDAGQPVTDPHLLIHAWKSQDVSGDIASSAFLFKLLTENPNVAHVVYHANLIRGFARKRKALTLAADLSRRCFEESDAGELFGWLEAECSAQRQSAPMSARPFAELADEVVADMQKQMEASTQPVLLSGLPKADDQGFVFAPGELTILAARPGVGKTTMATQIAIHHSMSHDRTVLMASLEMKATEVVKRTLVAASGNNNHLLRTSRVDQAIVNEIRAAKDGIGPIPFYVWSPGRVKASSIHAMSAVLHSAKNLQLLIVDYLGLVLGDPRMEKHERVGENTKFLRDIAQKLNIPVIVLCQLNRDADKGERPRLSNLRDSGEIEQDADVVAFLHREEKTGEVELIIAKNRQGSPGTVRLEFHPAQTRFSCISDDWQPNR
mgnify:CR=1 FL=1